MHALQPSSQQTALNAADGTATPFEKLQARLLARALRAFPEPQFEQPLRDAILLAARAALVSGSPVPTLPGLFREIAIAGMLRVEMGLLSHNRC